MITLDDAALKAIKSGYYSLKIRYDDGWRVSLLNENGCEMHYGNGDTAESAFNKMMDDGGREHLEWELVMQTYSDGDA